MRCLPLIPDWRTPAPQHLGGALWRHLVATGSSHHAYTLTRIPSARHREGILLVKAGASASARSEFASAETEIKKIAGSIWTVK
jgi:hypothetical protein